MMGPSSSSAPRLSYAHLFSFQVAYSNHMDSRGYANQGTFGFLGFAASLAKKKGEWNRAILEFDFVMETMFLQDKDRIVVSNTFPNYRRTVRSGGDSDDDTLLSIRFESEQWEIMVQNVEEKRALLHLLECIGRNATPEDVCELGKRKDIFGVDKSVMKHGMVLRKAKTAYKKDERYIVVVPGKLLMFMDDFSHWVKVIEASARGEKIVYSDEFDNYYDNNDQYSNRGGSRLPPEGSRMGNNNNYRSAGGVPYMHDDRMGRYGDDDRRAAQGRMPMREEMDGRYNAGRSRQQQPQQRGNYEQNRSSDYRSRPGYGDMPEDQFYRGNAGSIGMSKGRSDQGDAESWEQQQQQQQALKNANMRRRSVPLQCLDSALDDMAASIGNMQLYGGQQAGRNMGRMMMMPQQPEFMDGREDYGANYMNRPGMSKPPIQQPMGSDDKYNDMPSSSAYSAASSSSSSSYAPKSSVYGRNDANALGATMGGASSPQFPTGANKPLLPSGPSLEQPLPPPPPPHLDANTWFEKNVPPVANARMPEGNFNDPFQDQKSSLEFAKEMYKGQGYAG